MTSDQRQKPKKIGAVLHGQEALDYLNRDAGRPLVEKETHDLSLDMARIRLLSLIKFKSGEDKISTKNRKRNDKFTKFFNNVDNVTFNFDHGEGDGLLLNKDYELQFIDLLQKIFRISEHEANEDLRYLLTKHFNQRSKGILEDHVTNDFKPLCIPEGDPERYLGKKKSGEIYSFIARVYAYRDGGEPLTLEWLRLNDDKALTAFRGRRRFEDYPPEMAVLTDHERGSKQTAILAQYGIDLSTPQGEADARKLMSSIGHLLYERK